jgi:hypothetical protein
MSGMIGLARVGARMSPKQRLAVRHMDSAPLLSDLRNWFVGRVAAAEGVRAGVLMQPVSTSLLKLPQL